MRISVLLPFLTFILSVASAQDVVVSEYFNEVNPEQEWTEILVIKDDMNLVGYHVTDHEGQHERRIGGFTFRDVALWRHVRAGTIIVVFHRDVPANTRRDDNPDDGFLQFSKFDAAVFDPFLAADGPNINQDRDYIEILRPDSTHVHGLGHGNPGPVYVNSPRPKVLLDTGVIGGNRAPGIIGRSLAAYDADRTRDSAALTIGGSRGLPNQYDLPRTLQGFVSRNHLLWRELRQPTWSAAPTITIGSQTARSTEISWTPVTDVYPADGVTGVMILRDTNAFVGFPSALIRDGVNFGVGQSIGTAEVLAFVPTRDGTRFVDSNNVRCGARYTYRTYAYRFRPDDLLLPSQTPDSSARGRQWIDGQFGQSQTITKSTPQKPVLSASRTQICSGDTLTISAAVGAGITYYEWYRDGQVAQLVGTTSVIVSQPGTYRLRVLGEGGCFSESDDFVVTSLPAPNVPISPSLPQVICAGDSVVFTAGIDAPSYEWIRDGVIVQGATGRTFVARSSGEYIVRVRTQQGCPGVSPAVRVRLYDTRFRFEPPTLDFGVLGACENSKPATTEIVNDGTDSLTLTAANFPVGYSLVSPPVGTKIAPGSRRTVVILFAPPALGAFPGQASFEVQPCRSSGVLVLSGRRDQAVATLDQAALDLGTYTNCPNVIIRNDSVFRITNTGTQDIVIRPPQVDPPFYLISQFQQVVLQPGQTVDVRIQYRPLGADLNRGVINEIAFPFQGASCDDTLRATLRAATFTPSYRVETPTISYGEVVLCLRPTLDSVMTITNTGNVDIDVRSLTSATIVASDLPLTVEVGTTRTFRVSAPTSGLGQLRHGGVLDIGPCGSSDSIFVTATVQNPRLVSVSTSTYNITTTTCTSSAYLFFVTVQSGARIDSLRSRTLTNMVAIQDNDTARTIMVGFTIPPGATGPVTDTLRMYVGPCSDEAEVIVTYSRRDPEYTVRYTSDYGLVSAGSFAEDSVVITNTNTEVLSVQLPDPVPSPWVFLSTTPTLPVDLSPGDSAIIRFRYTHIGDDRYDTVRIPITMQVKDCPVVVNTVTLTGRTSSEPPPDTTRLPLQIVLPVLVTAYPGDDIDIDVALLTDSILTGRGVNNLRGILRYNGSLLRPLSFVSNVAGITGTVIERRPGVADVVISSQTELVQGDPIGRIRARTYLGTETSTVLNVDSVTADNAIVEHRDGQLTMLASCGADVRTISLGSPAALVVNGSGTERPTIVFTTVADDGTRLEILDANGRLCSTPVDGRLRASTYSVDIDTSQLASGLYVVVLRNGITVRSVPFTVYR
ncbi:MAG TPA: hypothetical protein DIS79_07160 [Bacteroidetes bacterium]|nr:hypothetical protein [Bacteroidota bacterium]HRK04309.1 T9SS type A sorting domain-containing protein [Chlorobiota bacterium]